MSARQEIADAASTVDGVTVTPYYRQTTRPGDGWLSGPRLDRDDTGLSYIDTWEVRIVQSTDLATADKWTEAHADALLSALRPVLWVTQLTQVTFQADQGNIPGLLITGVRPHPEGNEAR